MIPSLPLAWLFCGLLACVLDADHGFPAWVLVYDILLGPGALLIALARPEYKGSGRRSEELVMTLICVFALVSLALAGSML